MTSLQISFSSEMEGWKRCRCEAAMAGEKECIDAASELDHR
jgi:hypothetical protein